ncbi:MAG: 30S ribosome-binding factor RbfA [Desulfobacterales bacterium]
MKPFARSDRVGGQIQKILSEILLKKVKDPRLKNISITDVKLSRDLRIARVYFVISGNRKNIEDALEGFQSAIGYVKRGLARQLGLRYMPDLKFFYDESFDYGSHIDNVLKALKADYEPNNTLFEK